MNAKEKVSINPGDDAFGMNLAHILHYWSEGFRWLVLHGKRWVVRNFLEKRGTRLSFSSWQAAKQICMFLARETKRKLSYKASPRFPGCSVRILCLKFPWSKIYKFSNGVSDSAYLGTGIRHGMKKAKVCKTFRYPQLSDISFNFGFDEAGL